jgi:hypothetical protein
MVKSSQKGSSQPIKLSDIYKDDIRYTRRYTSPQVSCQREETEKRAGGLRRRCGLPGTGTAAAVVMA